MGNDDEVERRPDGAAPRASRSDSPVAPVPGGGQGADAAAEMDESKQVARSRDLFLRDVERELAKKELYNLDEQFEATKRNRSPLVWLAMLAFIAVLAVLAILVTTSIQTRSQQVPVSINAFNDVNLRDLLDKAKQLDVQMQNQKASLADLQAREAADIQNAQTAAAGQVDIVKSSLISDDQKQQRIAAIQAQTDAQVRAIRAQYAPKIAAARSAIAATQKSLDAYDARQVEQARRQEATLNNQQKLFDIQLQKTTSFYEERIRALNVNFDRQIELLKKQNSDFVALLRRNHATEIEDLIATYNPTFTSAEILGILGQQTGAADIPPDNASPVLVRQGVVDALTLSNLQAGLRDFGTLLARLRQVPYKNSIPSSLDHLLSLNAQIVSRYQEIAAGALERIAQQDQLLASRKATIDAYTHALDGLVKSNRENGYIIDARNPLKMAVFIDPVYKVTDGDAAYVFRRDDQQIATIVLHVSDDGTYATITSLAAGGAAIQPFDKVLLNLKQ